MWQMIGWIIWGIVALLALLAIRECRRRARSDQGLDKILAMLTFSLCFVCILFLASGWNKLHLLWAGPVAVFFLLLLATKKIPVISPVILNVEAVFLMVILLGIQKINLADDDHEDEDEDAMLQDDHIGKYKRIRKTARGLTGQITEHAPRFVLTRAARDLGMMGGRKEIIIFDSEEDTSFLMDRCFYDIYWSDKNLIGHFIASDDYSQLSEKQKTIVQGMTTAYYSLFEVKDVNPSDSTLVLQDLLGDGMYRIMDLSMSLTARRGYLLATRIHRIEGIDMLTGAACPFEEDQKEVLLAGLRPGKAAARKGKKRKRPREMLRSNYSAYFFKQYRRIGGIRFMAMDDEA